MYPIIIGGTKRKYLEEIYENGKKERQNAKGRQVITLNLAITLRVMLVGDFVKSLLTLYIYIIFKKVFLYKIGYRVPFKHDYFRTKNLTYYI